MSISKHDATDYSATVINGLFAGVPVGVLAGWIGRPGATVQDCRRGRSRWRAEDIIAAASRSDVVRGRTLALVVGLRHRDRVP